MRTALLLTALATSSAASAKAFCTDYQPVWAWDDCTSPKRADCACTCPAVDSDSYRVGDLVPGDICPDDTTVDTAASHCRFTTSECTRYSSDGNGSSCGGCATQQHPSLGWFALLGLTGLVRRDPS